MKAVLFLLPALTLGQGITMTPANPAVNEGSSLTINADRPVVFSLSGSGTLSGAGSKSVTYQAPSNVTPQHVMNGCMVLPNDSVFNTPINKLPVNSQSSNWTPYITNIGLGIEYTWGINSVDNSLPAASQNFHYTTQYNGTLFQIPSQLTKKRETGALTLDGINDHHLLSINRQTCQFYETYQDGVPVPNCPTCTAASGWTYSSTNHQQPATTDGGGTTDAAGLPLAPLTLHLSEIKAGAVNHALRFTTCVACIGNTFLWPATGSTGVQPGAPPMGARFRLKASFDISTYPPAAQTVLTALKQYGMILADVGMAGRITASSDVTEDPEVVAELQTISRMATYTDFEAVDESSFILSNTSNAVNPANPYQTPASYALLKVIDAANPANQVSIPIVINPVTVGTPDPTMVVQAGTPSFQIPYWVNGTSNQAVTWTVSPATGAGTITASGQYTAPSSVTGLTNATLTATSVADPTASTTIYVSLIPSGVIRIDSGSTTSTVDESGNAWLPDLAYETGTFNRMNDNYPTNAWGSIPAATVWQTYMYTYGDDIVYRMHVPNGNYKVALMSAIGDCTGTYNTGIFNNGLTNGAVNLQAQAQTTAHNFDFGLPINHQCRTPYTTYVPAKVTDTTLLIAVRSLTGPNGHSVPSLNGLTITPDTSAPHVAVDTQQVQSLPAGSQLQLYMVNWYTNDTTASWRVMQGGGTVTSTGLYTAPTPGTGLWVGVRALGNVSNSTAIGQFIVPKN